MRPNADRNLLFGMLALQLDFISQDTLIKALQVCVLDKDKPLSHILREQEALAEDELTLLEALMAKHLHRHGGDPEKSLVAVCPPAPVCQTLEQVLDPELHASLSRVTLDQGHETQQPPGTAPDNAPDATRFPPPSAHSGPRSRFCVLRHHAAGGLGNIFVAEDVELHREVALKEIRGEIADDSTSRDRFLLEAEITGRLEHP